MVKCRVYNVGAYGIWLPLGFKCLRYSSIGLKNGLLGSLRKAGCNILLYGTRHNNHDLVPDSGHIACYKRLKLTKKVLKIVISL